MPPLWLCTVYSPSHQVVCFRTVFAFVIIYRLTFPQQKQQNFLAFLTSKICSWCNSSFLSDEVTSCDSFGWQNWSVYVLLLRFSLAQPLLNFLENFPRVRFEHHLGLISGFEYTYQDNPVIRWKLFVSGYYSYEYPNNIRILPSNSYKISAFAIRIIASPSIC